MCASFKASTPAFVVSLLDGAPRVVLQSAMCIKSNKHHFTSTKEQHATAAQLSDFAKHVKAHAWQNAGTSSAKLKSGWECSGNDMRRAAAFIAAF